MGDYEPSWWIKCVNAMTMQLWLCSIECMLTVWMLITDFVSIYPARSNLENGSLVDSIQLMQENHFVLDDFE